MRRLRLFWYEYRWPLSFALLVGSLLLGYIGFARYAQATRQSLSQTDLLYLTLQLVTLESGSISGPLSWELEVARLLVPVLAGYSALLAAVSVFQEQVQVLRLPFLREHIVICGLGKVGLLLAQKFRARGDAVVVINSRDENELIPAARQQGALVITGDTRDMLWLERARLKRARLLIAVSGDDGVNADVAIQARQMCRGQTRRPLTAIVHLLDPLLWELMRERELESNDGQAFRLELFNLYHQGALALLAEYDPFPRSDRPPALVVVGTGQLGTNVVVEVARRWHVRQSEGATGRARITMIDNAAEERVAWLGARYPQLERAAELVPCQITIPSAEYEAGAFLLDDEGRVAADAAYICFDDETLSLQAGLTLLHGTRRHNFPIIVRTEGEGGLARLLADGPDRIARLRPFPLLGHICNLTFFLLGTHEVLAMALHDEYRRAHRGESVEENPAVAPWYQLSAETKEDNRRRADAICDQLDHIGWGVVPLTDWSGGPRQFSQEEVSEEEIEVMARMEHERWRAMKRKQGWRRGPRQRKKTNPLLRPWDKLPEEVKEANRASVRAYPAHLAHAGFRVVRLGQRQPPARRQARRSNARTPRR